jgi:hypothetical protein
LWRWCRGCLASLQCQLSSAWLGVNGGAERMGSGVSGDHPRRMKDVAIGLDA